MANFINLHDEASKAGAFSRTTTIFKGAKITRRRRKYTRTTGPLAGKTTHKVFHEIKLPPNVCEEMGIKHRTFVAVEFSDEHGLAELRISKAARGFPVTMRTPGKPATIAINAKVDENGEVLWEAPLPEELFLPNHKVDGSTVSFWRPADADELEAKKSKKTKKS